MAISNKDDIVDGEEYVDANGGQTSHPFALVSMRSMNVSYISTEPYTSKLRVLFHSLLIDDLFEPNCQWPLVKSVSAMSSVYEDKLITVSESALWKDWSAYRSFFIFDIFGKTFVQRGSDTILHLN